MRYQAMRGTGSILTAVLAVGLLLSIPAMAEVRQDSRLSGAVSDRISSEPYMPLDLIVIYSTAPGDQEISDLAYAGATEVTPLPLIDAVAVRLDAGQIDLVLEDPGIAWVAMDAPVHAMLDVAPAAAGLPVVRPINSAISGAGVTVAIIDSGIRLHDDLAGRVLARVDMVDTDSGTGDDLFGHGTHVAGILAGDGSSSDGFYRGMAPGASLVSVRVLDEHGYGMTSTVIAGLEWVMENRQQYGIRVVNMSLGHPVQEGADRDPLVLAVEAAWDNGLVVVCSAGNSRSPGNYTVNSPGSAPSGVTVGAATDQDTVNEEDDQPSTFTSSGPTLGDAVAKPDVVAPGNRVVSLRAVGSALDSAFAVRRVSYRGSKNYFEMSGTSMAAAMVSGAAALMLQTDPSLDPPSVKARLMRSARPLDGADPMIAGSGMLNVPGALADGTVVVSAPSPTLELDEDGTVQGVNDPASLRSDLTDGSVLGPVGEAGDQCDDQSDWTAMVVEGD